MSLKNFWIIQMKKVKKFMKKWKEKLKTKSKFETIIYCDKRHYEKCTFTFQRRYRVPSEARLDVCSNEDNMSLRRIVIRQNP
jgi:hypothetical protein